MKKRLSFLASLLTLSLFFSLDVDAQNVIPSQGKEFWVGFMENASSPLYTDLYISSKVNTSGTVSIPQQGWSIPFNVIANVTTTVVIPVGMSEHVGSEFVDNKGIYIESLDTISVYAINFQSFTADASKVLPIESIGTNYLVNASYGLPGFGNIYKSEFVIVATKDGTQIEITPSVLTAGGAPPGVPFIIDLDAGESYQVQSDQAADDLTGSTVVGTPVNGDCRPFAVFSGAKCVNIPGPNCSACDHVFDQNVDINNWGSTYFVVPFLGTTQFTYRIMARDNGTSYTVNGGAPQILNSGQFVELNAQTTPMCIVGTAPLMAAQYMEGQLCAGAGDPAMLILNAQEQMITNSTFSTVVSANLSLHYLNVITETTNINQVYFDGAQVAPAMFTVFPTCASHSYAQLSISAGSHTMTCTGGFSAYAYGTGNNESYAYSVGSNDAYTLVVDSVVCTTDTVTLTAPNGIFNAYWTTADDTSTVITTGNTYTFLPDSSQTYVVWGDQLISGCQISYYINVEVPTPPIMTTTANGLSTVTVCAFELVQLNTDPDPPSTLYQYSWTPTLGLNDPNIQNPILTATTTAYYVVNVTTQSGCTQAIDSVLVTVIDGNLQYLEASTQFDVLCLGDSSQLDVDIHLKILEDALDGVLAPGVWTSTTGGVLSIACGSISGDALYFDGAATRIAESVDMDMSAGGSVAFALKIANGTLAPCEEADPGEDIILEYSTNAGVTWTPMNTYLESSYPNFSFILEQVPIGAQTVATRFRWRQVAFSGAGEDNWALDNVSFGSAATTNLTIAWTPSATLSDPNIADPMSYPTSTGYYLVSIVDTVTACTYADSVFIDVGQPFTIAITNDTALCDVAGIQLNATPSSGTGHTWNWTPANGTLSSELIEDPIATPASTITYYVTVESGQGCTATDSVTITVNQLINLSVMANDSNICQGDTAYLTAVVANPGGLAFSWSPTVGLDDPFSQTPAASPPFTTNYIVTVTDTASGCQLVDSLEISISTAYFANATEDTTVCTAIGLPLDVVHNVPNPQYTWQPPIYLSNSSIQDPVVQFDSTMQYIVTIEDPIGCLISDTVNVTVQFDNLQFFSDSSICAGDSMVIDAGYPTSTYDWNTTETTQTITVFTAGAYTVTITDTVGCQATFTTNVTVDPLPVVLLPDTSLCDLETMVLDAGNPGSAYLWSTTETTQTIQLTTDELIWLQVTDLNNCVNSDTVDVTFDPLPVISLLDTIVCESETIILDAGNPGSTYAWSNSETTQTIAVNITGNFEVIVTTADLCSDSAEANITMIGFPVVDLGLDTALCDTQVLTIDAGNPGEVINWSTGATSQTIDVQTGAIYSVSVYNGYCTTYDSIDVIFNPLPLEYLVENITFCNTLFPKQVALDAGNPGSSYSWSTNETEQVIIVHDYGTYVVDITTAENCTITDEVLVEEFCPAVLYIPNAFTPDGDGNNDVFRVTGENIAALNMLIFDRWGTLIYESNQGEGWDGTIGGTPVQDGVYAWRVTYRFFTDKLGSIGTENEQMGHVTLVR